MKYIKTAMTVLFLPVMLPVQAADSEAGKAKSAICAACHGMNGISVISSYPNLAGQQEEYLRNALMAFKSGERKNAIMQAQVAGLSDEDMANLAAYYSSL